MSAPASRLETLFDTHYKRLCRVAYRVLGDAARAEEIAADVFCRYQARPPRREDNVEAWLCRTALRLALDVLRRRRRWQVVARLLRAPAAPARTDASEVRAVLARLGGRSAEILVLWSEGYTYAEIAAAVDVSPASVGTLLSRAQVAFRKEYESRYGRR